MTITVDIEELQSYERAVKAWAKSATSIYLEALKMHAKQDGRIAQVEKLEKENLLEELGLPFPVLIPKV